MKDGREMELWRWKEDGIMEMDGRWNGNGMMESRWRQNRSVASIGDFGEGIEDFAVWHGAGWVLSTRKARSPNYK